MPNEPFPEMCFYVVAHADDWQLFMNPNAYYDLLAPHTKVVFIVTTAGDAGISANFWTAREEGCKSSVRFCMAPYFPLSESSGTREFNHHSITFWSANHVTCYFLRLPDGNLDGNGFPVYHNQSLARLREGKLNPITALDNSATYNDWRDFYTTLQTIIKYKAGSDNNININYIDPDKGRNQNDHADHITTGQAIQEMSSICNLRQVLFTGYSMSATHKNLSLVDLFWKTGMFAVYEKTVYDKCGYSTLKENASAYIKWCLRCPDFITIEP